MTDGFILPDALYTFEEVEERLHFGKHVRRKAQRKGLKVRYYGRQGYVLGRDLIEHIVNNSSERSPSGDDE